MDKRSSVTLYIDVLRRDACFSLNDIHPYIRTAYVKSKLVSLRFTIPRPHMNGHLSTAMPELERTIQFEFFSPIPIREARIQDENARPQLFKSPNTKSQTRFQTHCNASQKPAILNA
jgi:hypothetical protein